MVFLVTYPSLTDRQHKYVALPMCYHSQHLILSVADYRHTPVGCKANLILDKHLFFGYTM